VLRLIWHRLLVAVPTLLLLIILAFVLMRVAPGSPFASERNLPPAVEANLNERYGLGDPLGVQLLRYLSNLSQGDFGPSLYYSDHDVADLILEGFPTSLRLGLAAILLALGAGVTVGIAAARRPGSMLDHLLMGVAIAGISIPNFVVAPLLILVFAVWLGWLPASGAGPDSTLGATGMILPVIALALPQFAYVARLTRASMLEVLDSSYVLAARGKGLPEYTILLRHGLRPALLPVVSYLGPATAAVITGSVVIEEIFGLPGLGKYFVQAALNRDYFLVLGVVVFYGFLVVLANLLVDLCYGVLDPRVRQQ
jgi:oligopeptide transport system permease protein